MADASADTGNSGTFGAALVDEMPLMRRIAQGDRAAFDDFYRAYSRRVRSFLEGLLPRHALVGEVLNDTMLVVWRKAGSYNGSSKLTTWLFAIAHRRALNALRRNAPRFAPTEAGEIRSGPDIEAQRLELREQLASALGGLPMPQRAVLELSYFGGFACREIADIMACPVDTVKTRAFHARRRLRRLLEGHDNAAISVACSDASADG